MSNPTKIGNGPTTRGYRPFGGQRVPRRVLNFFSTYYPIMQRGLRQRFQTTSAQFDHNNFGRLGLHLAQLLRIQNLAVGQAFGLDMGDVAPPNVVPSGLTNMAEVQYRIRFIAETLGIYFAYDSRNHLVMGERGEIERGVAGGVWNYQRSGIPAGLREAKGAGKKKTKVAPRPAQRARGAEEHRLPVVVSREVALPAVTTGEKVKRAVVPWYSPRVAYLKLEVRAMRIRQLVSEGDYASASLLLFGGGTSHKLTDVIIETEQLRFSLARLCEAGDTNSVADYLYWVGRQRGSQEVLDIIRGRSGIVARQVDPVAGFSDQRKAAVILFKLSMKARGREVVDGIFRAAAEYIEPGDTIVGALNELHRCQPEVYKNYDEYVEDTSSVFNPWKRLSLRAIAGKKKNLETAVESIAPAIVPSGQKSQTTSLVLYHDRNWEFEYGQMDPIENLAASVQELAARRDFETACYLIFAVERTQGERAAVFRLGRLNSFQIAGILEHLGPGGIREFLVEAAEYGKVSRGTGEFFSYFFDGILFGLSRMETGFLVRIFDAMVYYEDAKRPGQHPQRQAAYMLLHEGVDPTREKMCGKYLEVVEALCASREAYRRVTDFILKGKLLPEDEAPKAPRAQVAFYDGLMREESRSSAIRLQAMVRLAQLGGEKRVRRYVRRELTKEAFLEMTAAVSEDQHPFINFYNLDILMSFVDYDCGETFVVRLRGTLTETADRRLVLFVEYLHYINIGIGLMRSEERSNEGWLMLLKLKDRRLTRLVAPALRHEDAEVRAAFATNLPLYGKRTGVRMARRLTKGYEEEVNEDVGVIAPSPSLREDIRFIVRVASRGAKRLIKKKRKHSVNDPLFPRKTERDVRISIGVALVAIYKMDKDTKALGVMVADPEVLPEVKVSAYRAMFELGDRKGAIVGLREIITANDGVEKNILTGLRMCPPQFNRAYYFAYETLAELYRLGGQVEELIAIFRKAEIPSRVKLVVYAAAVEACVSSRDADSLAQLSRAHIGFASFEGADINTARSVYDMTKREIGGVLDSYDRLKLTAQRAYCEMQAERQDLEALTQIVADRDFEYEIRVEAAQRLRTLGRTEAAVEMLVRGSRGTSYLPEERIYIYRLLNLFGERKTAIVGLCGLLAASLWGSGVGPHNIQAVRWAAFEALDEIYYEEVEKGSEDGTVDANIFSDRELREVVLRISTQGGSWRTSAPSVPEGLLTAVLYEEYKASGSTPPLDKILQRPLHYYGDYNRNIRAALWALAKAYKLRGDASGLLDLVAFAQPKFLDDRTMSDIKRATREAAHATLHELYSETGSIDGLISIASDANVRTGLRISACETLYRLRDELSVEYLREIATSVPDSQDRIAAYLSLAQCGQRQEAIVGLKELPEKKARQGSIIIPGVVIEVYKALITFDETEWVLERLATSSPPWGYLESPARISVYEILLETYYNRQDVDSIRKVATDEMVPGEARVFACTRLDGLGTKPRPTLVLRDIARDDENTGARILAGDTLIALHREDLSVRALWELSVSGDMTEETQQTAHKNLDELVLELRVQLDQFPLAT